MLKEILDEAAAIVALGLFIGTLLLWTDVIRYYRSMEQVRPLGNQVCLKNIGQQPSCQF